MVDMVARSILFAALLCLIPAAWAQKYTGPRPAKTDVPYLMHASNLVQTEVQEAQQEGKKDSSTYTVPGASSTAKTPLAEPILILATEKLTADSLELYK